jgi:hypothetical protein
VQQAGKVLTFRNSLNNSLAKFTEAHERDGTVDIDSARDFFQQSIDILSDIGADIGGSKGLYVHKRKTTDLQRESRNVLTDVTNTIGGPNGQLPATTPTTSVRHNTRSQSSSENNKRTPSQSNNSNNKSHKKKARVTTPANRRTSTRKRSRATDTPTKIVCTETSGTISNANAGWRRGNSASDCGGPCRTRQVSKCNNGRLVCQGTSEGQEIDNLCVVEQLITKNMTKSLQ